MKREGCQHVIVRCHRILPEPLNPRPGSTRYLNRFESPPTAGLFTRVTTKPANHSKFTGKCGRPRCRACHESPVQKSKDKTKGMQKSRLVTWRVSEAKPGSKLRGFSATGLLDEMDGEDEKQCGIGSLDVDVKDFNEDECENRDCDGEKGDDICDLGIVWDDWIDDQDEDWCFVEETFSGTPNNSGEVFRSAQ